MAEKIIREELAVRSEEARKLRELFYAFGPRHGHAGYVGVAHVLGAGLYGPETQWVGAMFIAVRALVQTANDAYLAGFPEPATAVREAYLNLLDEFSVLGEEVDR